ncbi:mCG140610 [Mus musculus]|nr:mCG140610 [Mus musculus]
MECIRRTGTHDDWGPANHRTLTLPERWLVAM